MNILIEKLDGSDIEASIIIRNKRRFFTETIKDILGQIIPKRVEVIQANKSEHSLLIGNEAEYKLLRYEDFKTPEFLANRGGFLEEYPKKIFEEVDRIVEEKKVQASWLVIQIEEVQKKEAVVKTKLKFPKI